MATAVLDPVTTRAFVLAGRATFTAVSDRTGSRFTFQVRRCNDRGQEGRVDRPWFVSVLTGQDNTSKQSYKYLGTIYADSQGQAERYLHGKKSKLVYSSPAGRAAEWVITHIIRRQAPPGTTIWHEGRCGRCGRMLTVPASIKNGFGPECTAALTSTRTRWVDSYKSTPEQLSLGF